MLKKESAQGRYTTVSFTREEVSTMRAAADEIGFTSLRRFVLYATGQKLKPLPGKRLKGGDRS